MSIGRVVQKLSGIGPLVSLNGLDWPARHIQWNVPRRLGYIPHRMLCNTPLQTALQTASNSARITPAGQVVPKQELKQSVV